MPASASPFAPFRHADFRMLWIATLLSNAGGLIQAVGAGWAMTTISGSPQMVALVQASTTLPIMLFSLAAGALADNFDRRKLMLIAQVMMMLVSIALAVLTFLGWLTPWILLCFTFLIGCGSALHNPAWQASVGDMVPRQDIPAAVSLNSMGFNSMRSIGPALGGLIVAVAGAAAAFTINAFSYIAFIIALWRWKPEYAPRTLPRERFGGAIWAGLRYVSMSPHLIKVMIRGGVFGFSAVVVVALLPLVARDMVDGGAFAYGAMLGCFGFGAIGGALINARLRENVRNEIVVRMAFTGFAVSVAVLAISRDLLLSCIAVIPAGASWVMALALFNVSVQLSTPRWVVARALALYQTAVFAGMTAGAWLWGVAADGYGVERALAFAALVLVAGGLMGLRFPLPEISNADLTPLDNVVEPQLKLDLRQRSGPIMVMVEYVIDEVDIPEFLNAMTDRRRIRIRDGARQWALLRDLENPSIWNETYHVPTWVDYMRHQHRRTHADVKVNECLVALHKGPARPRVRRMIERQTVPVIENLRLKEPPAAIH